MKNTASSDDSRSLPDAAEAAAFADALLGWFAAAQRPLPWRVSYTPYEVWISEIMLQQTQMDRGVSYFRRWMEALPDIASVAAADEEDILRLWEGLGYYSRARNLHAAAKRIMERHGGVFPENMEEIRALPGIGPYTAAAIAGIAFQQHVACIDANVERVLARVFDIDVSVREKAGITRLRRLSEALLPVGRERDYNQAMMELGALVCGKKAQCAACPLAFCCLAKRRGTVDLRPVLPERTAVQHITAVAGVLQCGKHIFLRRRAKGGLWSGLWEFPGGGTEEGEKAEAAAVRLCEQETGFRVRSLGKICTVSQSHTHFRVTMHCYRLALENCGAHGEMPPEPLLGPECEWVWEREERLHERAMSAGHRRLADRLGSCEQLSLGIETRSTES